MVKKQNNKDLKGYIPLVDGRPTMWGGKQLVFCTDSTWRDEPFNAKLYKSKATIRKQIQKSREYRRKQKFETDGRYSILTVEE